MEAVRHAFLMHGVLALSALHLASLKSDRAEHYARLCDKHQAIALASYRSTLGHITDDVADAIFALATILSISSLARSTLRASLMPDPQHISVEAICELLYMTRGVREVREAAGDAILQGPFSVLLFGWHRSPDIRVALSPHLAQTLRMLRGMIHDHSADSPDKLRACLSTLDLLEDTFKNIVYFYSRNELEIGQIWSWGALLSYDFIKLVQSSYPPALVLCAYFSVATLTMKNAWFFASWGRFSFQGILLALDGRLSNYLGWCHEQLATDNAGLKYEAGTIKCAQDFHRDSSFESMATANPQGWVDQWSELQTDERMDSPTHADGFNLARANAGSAHNQQHMPR